MNLRSVQRQLPWPDDVSALHLRSWVRQELAAEGTLLRWAVTAVDRSADGSRRVAVEAVLIG